MNDSEMIKLLAEKRVLAVVRASSAESGLRAAEAAVVGGIGLVEVSMATPGALRVIYDLRHRYGDRVCVGAGSVTNYDQIDRAVKSGAQFIATPHTSMPLVEFCRRRRLAAIIGALTPTEITAAGSVNAPVVMVFPVSSLGGPDYLRSLTASMPELRLGARGGVEDDVGAYFDAGAFAVAVGRGLFKPGDLQNENYGAIAERARTVLKGAKVA